MSDRSRSLLLALACAAQVALLCTAAPVLAHTVDCSDRSGIDLARCVRHQKMAAKCGPIKGEAHFVCDREFLLAHPLECQTLSGDDAKRCTGEQEAFKTCEPRQGRDFLVCVRDTTKASPIGTQ